jgi:conjugal transfer pilus assembly protein TraL
MKELDFPRHLDDPPMLLIWRMDDLMPVVLGLCAGILTDWMLPMLLAGVGASYGYRRFRDSKPDGFILHKLYWWGLIPLQGRSIPNAFSRRFAP